MSSHARTMVSFLGLGLCLYLAPIQSTIWNETETPHWISALTVIQSSSATLYQAAGASLDITPYYFFGRFFFLIYLSLFISLTTLFPYASQTESMAKNLHRALAVFLGLAAIGNLIAYWGGGWFGTDVRFVGFWVIEVPSLALSLIGLSALGVTLLKHPARPWLTALILILTPVFSIAATMVFQYMPHGPVLGIAAALFFISLLNSSTTKNGPASAWPVSSDVKP